MKSHTIFFKKKIAHHQEVPDRRFSYGAGIRLSIPGLLPSLFATISPRPAAAQMDTMKRSMRSMPTLAPDYDVGVPGGSTGSDDDGTVAASARERAPAAAPPGHTPRW
jgi:hypothetical protein